MDLKESLIAKPGHRHPWELARAYFLIQKIFPKERSHLLDIGSGDLFLLKSFLQRNSTSAITAVDSHYNSQIAKVPGIELKNSYQGLLPDSFDTVTLLDVVEHVEDDQLFLNEVKKFVSQQGQLIITVPAHQFLFSQHDLFLQHFRRYSSDKLISVIDKKEFEVKFVFSFFFSLFIVRSLQKMLTNQLEGKNQSGLANWKYPENHLLTKLVFYFLLLDCYLGFYLARIRIKIPGLSLCLIAKKKRN